MSALDTKIVTERMQDYLQRERHHQGSNLNRDIEEMTETCERLQMAENILQELVNAQPWRGIFQTHGNNGITVWFDESPAEVTPDKLKYLESLVQ